MGMRAKKACDRVTIVAGGATTLCCLGTISLNVCRCRLAEGNLIGKSFVDTFCGGVGYQCLFVDEIRKSFGVIKTECSLYLRSPVMACATASIGNPQFYLNNHYERTSKFLQ